MADERSNQVMEIYKLHAELADRVSQRRLGTNRFYASVLVGITLSLGALLRVDGSPWQDGMLCCAIGVVGVLLAASWALSIRSYERLNHSKFDALWELEDKLAYKFFTKEWGFLGHGKEAVDDSERSKYTRLSRIEQTVPWVFGGLYLVVLGFGIWLLKNGGTRE